MAPKKPGKDAKGKNAEEKEGEDAKGKNAEEKEDLPQRDHIQEILNSPITMTAAAVLTLLLVVGAVAMVALSIEEEKIYEDDKKGLVLLRDFVIGNNESLKGKTDKEIIQAAYNFMKELTIIRNKNEALKNITEFLDNENEWIPAADGRFCFSTKAMQYSAASQYCISHGAVIVSVINEELEEFLEKKASEKGSNFWIGLKRNQGDFSWENHEKLLHTFWDSKFPSDANLGLDCTVIASTNCQPLKCWKNQKCDSEVGVICMKKRDPQWMF